MPSRRPRATTSPASHRQRQKVWWYVRFHPFFDTIEIRICDEQPRVDGTQEVSRAYPERAVIGSENWCG